MRSAYFPKRGFTWPSNKSIINIIYLLVITTFYPLNIFIEVKSRERQDNLAFEKRKGEAFFCKKIHSALEFLFRACKFFCKRLSKKIQIAFGFASFYFQNFPLFLLKFSLFKCIIDFFIKNLYFILVISF